MLKKEWGPNWRVGEVIRGVLTGKAYLVMHLYKIGDNQTSTCVIDLEAKRDDPIPLKVICQGEYDKYVRDTDMDVMEDGGVVKYKYNHINI